MSKLLAFAAFFIVANPLTYKLTSNLPILGNLITDDSGRPTQVGVLIHAAVFVLVMHFISQMKKN